MFSKANKAAKRSGGSDRPVMPSIISANLRITGNLESEGDIQIDGVVEGDIKSESLTVSDSATVRGAIDAETVTIAGSVTGQIKAKSVTLMRTAGSLPTCCRKPCRSRPGPISRVIPAASRRKPSASWSISQTLMAPCR